MASHASSHDSHDEHGDDYHHHAHIASIRTNALVFVGLLALTLLTVAAYKVRLGEFNLAIAIIIASMKASLVCTWFMHLKYEARFNTLFFVGTTLFVAVFVGYTVNDTEHRGQYGSIQSVRIDPETGAYAHGTTGLVAENGEFQLLEAPTEEGEAAEGAAAEEAAAEGAEEAAE